MSAKQTKTPTDTEQKPDRAAVRAAKLDQFTWSRDASLDPNIGQAAKHLAARLVMDIFGTRGTGKATQKELGRIICASPSTVRRAIEELTAGYYLTVEQLGGANRYEMVPPDERTKIWCDEEQEFNDKARRWDAAKRQWEWNCTKWLEAEAKYFWLQAEEMAREEFTMPIFAAVSKRAAANNVADAYGLAVHSAEHWWHWENRMRSPGSPKIVELFNAIPDAQIVELAMRRGFHTPAPRCTVCDTELDDDRADLGTCLDCSWTAEGAPWAAEGQSPPVDTQAPYMDTQAPYMDTQVSTDEHLGVHSQVSDLHKQRLPQGTSRPFKAVEVHQDASPTGRAPTGAPSGAAQQNTTTPAAEARRANPGADGCRLCNRAGEAIALGAAHVIMFMTEDDDEYPLMCRHSLDANYAAIKALMRETSMEPNWTGYGEEIDGPEDYAEVDCNSLSRQHVPPGWGE